MCITARQLVIILLIFSQGIILWQGSFASAKMNLAVDTENTHCIQDHMTQVAHNDEMDCDCCNQHDCIGFCYCHSCVHSSLGLIFSVPSPSFSSSMVLLSIFFVLLLNGHSAQLFKPPRKFCS